MKNKFSCTRRIVLKMMASQNSWRTLLFWPIMFVFVVCFLCVLGTGSMLLSHRFVQILVLSKHSMWRGLRLCANATIFLNQRSNEFAQLFCRFTLVWVIWFEKLFDIVRVCFLIHQQHRSRIDFVLRLTVRFLFLVNCCILCV